MVYTIKKRYRSNHRVTDKIKINLWAKLKVPKDIEGISGDYESIFKKIQADWNCETDKRIKKLENHSGYELTQFRKDLFEEEAFTKIRWNEVIDSDGIPFEYLKTSKVASEIKTILRNKKKRLISIENKSYKKLVKLQRKVYDRVIGTLFEILAEPNGTSFYNNKNYKRYTSHHKSLSRHQSIRLDRMILLWLYDGDRNILIRYLGSKGGAEKLFTL